MASTRFRVDHFTRWAPLWDRFVAGTLRAADKPWARRALVVGAHEGRSCVWLLRRVLKPPPKKRGQVAAADALLLVADAFDYHDCEWYGGRAAQVGDVRATFDAVVPPLARAAGVALRIEGGGLSALEASEARAALQQSFGVVAVECTQGARGALDALVRAFPFVAPGGVLIATNYTHSREHDGSCPRPGIDAFVRCFADQLHVMHDDWHVFIQRRTHPLPLPRCLSEYHEEFRPVPSEPACSQQQNI